MRWMSGKVGVGGVLIVMIVGLVAFNAAYNPRNESTSSPAEKTREQIRAYFISDSEPKVKDAVWASDNIFKVAMFDNGDNRAGYAQYVCEVLNDAGYTGVWVQVMDLGKLMHDESWVKLGEAHC